MQLKEIWRYPVKSLTGEPINRVVLNPGLGLPNDRRWALARPNGKAANGKDWHPKSQFFVLVREDGLAKLHCQFEDQTGIFNLKGPNGLQVSGNLAHTAGRTTLAKAIAQHLDLKEDDAPILVETDNFGYFDSTQGPVSLLNMASHRALETAIGQTLDPVRFRMNFFIEGCDPWCETRWIGKHIRMGRTLLQVTENTGRCKATHINPKSGLSDVKIVNALKNNFGHTRMGVYAKVIEGGLLEPGASIEILDET